VSTAVVVGAGPFGAATVRERRPRGWQVTLFEQYAPVWYAQMARDARTRWLELEVACRR
jgi:cation diffusion facilitator CzcD-associated flavoprotein CzcO